MLGDGTPDDSTRGAVFGSSAFLERGAKLDGMDAVTRGIVLRLSTPQIRPRPTRSHLLAGDPVLVAVEASVVGQSGCRTRKPPVGASFHDVTNYTRDGCNASRSWLCCRWLHLQQ
jgi:hypothetical protein